MGQIAAVVGSCAEQSVAAGSVFGDFIRRNTKVGRLFAERCNWAPWPAMESVLCNNGSAA